MLCLDVSIIKVKQTKRQDDFGMTYRF